MRYPPVKSNDLPFLLPLRIELCACATADLVPAVILQLNPDSVLSRVVPEPAGSKALPTDMISLAHNAVVAGLHLFQFSAVQFEGYNDYALAARANPHLEQLFGTISQNNGGVLWKIHVYCNDPIIFSRFDGSAPDKQPTSFDRFAAFMRHIEVRTHLGSVPEEAKAYHWQPLKAIKALATVMQIPFTVYVDAVYETDLPIIAEVVNGAEVAMNTVIVPSKEMFSGNQSACFNLFHFCLANGFRISAQFKP